MGLLKKFRGAVTYWTDANARRSGIFGTTQAYSGSLVVIGVVLLALALSGKFPPHANQHPSQLVLYCAKYALYILSGACAVISIRLACSSLSQASSSSYLHGQRCSKPALAMPKVLLYVAMLAVLASIAMTIVSLAKTASSPVHVPGYTYAIEVVVLLARLLLLSTFLLVLITLKEAERDPVVAGQVVAGAALGDSGGSALPSTQTTSYPFTSYQPSGPTTSINAPYNNTVSPTHMHNTPHDAGKPAAPGDCISNPAGHQDVRHMLAVPENSSQCYLGAGMPSGGVAAAAGGGCLSSNLGHSQCAAPHWNAVAVGQPVSGWQPQHHYRTASQAAVPANCAASTWR